jgi:hypothetical protein
MIASGCRRSEPAVDSREQAPAVAEATSAAEVEAPPVDHLAPGELVEGTQQAFGVTLPREVVVDESFVDAVYASGPATLDALVPYFRSRLEGGTAHQGPTTATFEHTRARGKADRAAVDVLVRVTSAPGGARVEIRNTTPPPAPVLPDQAARWRQVGLTPEGRIADPSHLD